MRRRKGNGTEKLVNEAERLRLELIKTAARVGEFSEILSSDARTLMYETQHKEGVGDEPGDEPPAPGSSGTGPGPGVAIDQDRD